MLNIFRNVAFQPETRNGRFVGIEFVKVIGYPGLVLASDARVTDPEEPHLAMGFKVGPLHGRLRRDWHDEFPVTVHGERLGSLGRDVFLSPPKVDVDYTMDEVSSPTMPAGKAFESNQA
jgi:hypothetical protein